MKSCFLGTSARGTVAAVAASVFLLSLLGCSACWPVVYVSTTAELAKAIGSNREVRILPGQYNLDNLVSLARQCGNAAIGCGAPGVDAYSDETRHPYGPPSWWCRRYMWMQSGILQVENLTLKGEGPPGSVELFVTYESSDVLSILYSKNVRLENLTLGHHVEPGHCGGGVLAAWFVDGLEIVDCDLYGCGTVGVELTICDEVLVQDSVIRECTEGILEAQGCRGIRVVNSTAADCQGGMDFLSCNPVVIDSCTFSGIVGFEGLPQSQPNGLVTWTDDRLWLNELITDDPEILQGLKLDEPDLKVNGCQAVDCGLTSLAGPWRTESTFRASIWQSQEHVDPEEPLIRTGFVQSAPNEPLAMLLPRFLRVLGEKVFDRKRLMLVSLDDGHAIINLVDGVASTWDVAVQGEDATVIAAELLQNLLQPGEDLPGWIDSVEFIRNGEPFLSPKQAGDDLPVFD